MLIKAETLIHCYNLFLAGLPNVEWDILRIDAASRENLCQRQLAYCAVCLI
jgi:hypothetical protein